MDFRRLRYFVTVAEEGHVTRAAEKLGIQQPPLSQQIKLLEDELGVQLFQRLPRGVALTAAGETLFEDAERILGDVERAQDKVGRTARGLQGAIAIGFTSSAPFHPFIPDTLRQFRSIRPDVSLDLEERGSAALVEAVSSSRIDAAFIRSPSAATDGVTLYRLFDETMVVAIPKAHPLAEDADTPIPLSALDQEPFVFYRRHAAPGLFDAIIAACHQVGAAPRFEQQSPRITSTLNLVAVGLGVTVVPASLRQVNLDGIVYRPLEPGFNLTAPMILATRTVENSPAARTFIDLVRKSAHAL